MALEALAAFLDGIAGTLPAGTEVTAVIGRSRFAGLDTDYAHGLIEASLPSPFGMISVTSGWEAFTQARPENGWCVVARANAKGEGVFTELAVVDGTDVCEPSGEFLSEIAWQFWSYLDFDPYVLPLLSSRTA